MDFRDKGRGNSQLHEEQKWKKKIGQRQRNDLDPKTKKKGSLWEGLRRPKASKKRIRTQVAKGGDGGLRSNMLIRFKVGCHGGTSQGGSHSAGNRS